MMDDKEDGRLSIFLGGLIGPLWPVHLSVFE